MKFKVNNRGFTLAELLIVVAIIAILTAVAMPIFMDALDDARLAVENANVRTVKEIAVAEILSDPDNPIYNLAGDEEDNGWYVCAVVDAAGTISESMAIDRSFYEEFKADIVDGFQVIPGYKKISDYAVICRDDSGSMTIFLFLKPIDLESPSSGG